MSISLLLVHLYLPQLHLVHRPLQKIQISRLGGWRRLSPFLMLTKRGRVMES